MNLDDLPAGYRIDADGVARRAAEPVRWEAGYLAETVNTVESVGRRPGGPAKRTTPEKVWQAKVIATARRNGWTWFHAHDSRRSPAGFPDLVLVRDRVIFAELKTDTGRLSEAQQEWLARLTAAGAEVYVWRPSSEAQVLEVLA